MELKQNEGQFAFDGKLTIDAEAGNHAYALAYLPAGNYQFVINTGITELGLSLIHILPGLRRFQTLGGSESAEAPGNLPG